MFPSILQDLYIKAMKKNHQVKSQIKSMCRNQIEKEDDRLNKKWDMTFPLNRANKPLMLTKKELNISLTFKFDPFNSNYFKSIFVLLK